MNKYLFVGSERQREIALILQKEHFAKCQELAERFGVSEKTIRTDIKALKKILPINVMRGRYQGGIYMDHGDFVE